MVRFKYLRNLLIAGIFVLCMLPESLYAQHQFTMVSPLIPARDTVWVFTPSKYKKSHHAFPVVYLLHGYSGNYHQWNDIINLQKIADEYGFVIVCPDGFYDSWYLNSPVQKDHQYARFFIDELMPEIKHRFKIDPDKAFITGLSMGGHGALYLFLKHPEKFVSAGSTSGVVNLPGAGDTYGLPKLLGKLEQHRARWEKYSVSGNLKNIAHSDKKIIFDCGWNGPFFKMNEALRDESDSLGIDATFITRPGKHNYAYWKTSIPMHFFFFKNLLDKTKRHNLSTH